MAIVLHQYIVIDATLCQWHDKAKTHSKESLPCTKTQAWVGTMIICDFFIPQMQDTYNSTQFMLPYLNSRVETTLKAHCTDMLCRIIMNCVQFDQNCAPHMPDQSNQFHSNCQLLLWTVWWTFGCVIKYLQFCKTILVNNFKISPLYNSLNHIYSEL